MAVPKKRTSRARRNQRRAHDAIKLTAAIEACPNCGELKKRHHLCLHCGYYRSRTVIETTNVEVSGAE